MSKNMASLDRQLDNHCKVVGALCTLSLQIGSTKNLSSSLPSSGVDTSATESVRMNETRSYSRTADRDSVDYIINIVEFRHDSTP